MLFFKKNNECLWSMIFKALTCGDWTSPQGGRNRSKCLFDPSMKLKYQAVNACSTCTIFWSFKGEGIGLVNNYYVEFSNPNGLFCDKANPSKNKCKHCSK